jgi:hypothetical protein
MSQKKIVILGQNQHSRDQSNLNYHKGSAVELLRSLGIPSRKTTHEKLGQTTLIFTHRAKPPVEDDSLEASIINMKFKR